MKKKLQSIKSLETKIWKECVRIIRARYPHVCVSCGREVEGKNMHCGHYFRKKFIPLRTRYLLDNLRIQCSYCNLRLHGNLENYTVYLLKEKHFNIVSFAKLISQEKLKEYSVQEEREYLQELLEEYKAIDN